MKRIYYSGALAAIGILIGLWVTDNLPGTAPIVAVDADCAGNVAVSVRYDKAFGSGDFDEVESPRSKEYGVDSLHWADMTTADSQADCAVGEVCAMRSGMRYRAQGGTWSETVRLTLDENDARTAFQVDPGVDYEYEIVLNEEGRPTVLTNGTFGVDICPAEYEGSGVRLEADSDWYENQPQ